MPPSRLFVRFLPPAKVVISATIIKDPKLTAKVADKIFDKINMPQFDDKNLTRGEELMQHLVKLAGKDWLVATLAKIDRKMPSFLKKQVSPEVATEVLCKGALASDEKQAVERILAEAKAKEGETFVMGGFYLGMPINDAAILLRHYSGLKWDVETRLTAKSIPLHWFSQSCTIVTARPVIGLHISGSAIL